MGFWTFLMAAVSVYSPPVLNPTIYDSPDRAFELEVDPSEPDGSGPGRYRLTRDGNVIWEGEHPFTFFDAGVASDGTVAGVAYTRGLTGGGYQEDNGELIVAVLAPGGEVRFTHAMQRKWSGVIHGHPVPQSKGVLLDEVTGRVLLRLFRDYQTGEEWLFYELGSGESVLRFDPKTLDTSYLDDVRRLKNGFGFLLNWMDQEASRPMVLSPNLERQWSHELADRASVAAVTKEGFTLELKEASELVDFEVASRSGRVRVHASGRRPVEAAEDNLAALPSVDLPLLGTIELGGGASDHPIRNVYDFDIDAHGNIGFVRCAQNELTFVLVDDAGVVLAEWPLDLVDDDDGCPLTAWLGGEKWVVATGSTSGTDTNLFALDVSSGSDAPFAQPEGANLYLLRGGDGGSLVTLHTAPTVLRVFDAVGHETVVLHGDSGEDSLFSPEDVAPLVGGGFAVVDNIRGAIQLFGAGGVLVENIDLQAVLGRKPNYPVEIAAAPDGGFAVWDFGAPKPLLLLGPGGTLLAELVPRYGDGTPTGRLRNLRYAPDGALWASDGVALLRLDENGVVDEVLGAMPSASALTDVVATARDAGGKYYLVDRRTGSIHVFEPSGTFSHRCDPNPDDFADHLSSAHITVAGDGTVFLERAFEGSYLVFDAEGRRVERRATEINAVAEDWYAHPLGPDRWVATMDELYLTDRNGDVLRRIRRHGDRTWLDSPRSAAVASDGTVALLTGGSGWYGPGEKLGVFTVDGDAVLTKSFPTLPAFASIAFDAGVIVIGTEEHLIVLGDDGEPVARFEPEVGYDRSYWDHFLANDGSELQLLDRTRRLVYRYDLTALQ